MRVPRLTEACPNRSSRLATVGFLFQRKGCVRVSVEKGENFEARMEKLIETALEAEAEDFEESDDISTSEAVEIQVRTRQRLSIPSLSK